MFMVFMRKFYYYIIVLLCVNTTYAQPVRPPKPPPYSPSNEFKPIPLGEKDPCPSPACDCISMYPNDPSQRILDEDESVCIDCSNGEKVLQPKLTYWKYHGPCSSNPNCPDHGALYQKIHVFAEQPKRVFGKKLWEKTVRPDDDECKECPQECPDKLIDCQPVRSEDCDIIDPNIEEQPDGSPECFCQIPT